MTYVQLGWIQDAIDYIFDKILSPIFNWLSGLLSDVFSFIFDTVLGGVLKTVIQKIVEIAAKLIWSIIARFFFMIERYLLIIVDMLEDCFKVLAGVKDVSTTDGRTGSLLSILAGTGFVTTTILIVVAVSVVLCFFFSILATIKSISDMGGQESKPVGHVIRMTAQALFRMILIPIMGLFLIVLGDKIMVSITTAMTLSENSSIARTIFVMSTLDAVNEDDGAKDMKGNLVKSKSEIRKYNSSTRYAAVSGSKDAADYGLTDKFRKPFYEGTKSYRNWTDVGDTFALTRIDYFIGIGCAFFFIMILGTIMFVLVSRIFDVIVLLIIEPLFVCQMPLDDGEAYKKWSDLFLGKLFSGYGMVVAMYLYLLVAAQVFNGEIAFFPPGTDTVSDYLMKMLLLIGGGFAVMQAGPLVTSILSVMASMNESATMAAGSAFTGQIRGLAVGAPVASFAKDIGKDYVFDKIKKSDTYQKAEAGFEGFMDNIGLSDPKYHQRMQQKQQRQQMQNGGMKFNGGR